MTATGGTRPDSRAKEAIPGAAGYEIIPCHPGLLPQAAALLRFLTHRDASRNHAYLTWKYLDNPYLQPPPMIAALRAGEVVGFRGYLATRWRVPGGEITILGPGDTCVHPDHRRRGLSVLMGNRAREEFGGSCRLFLNSSSNRSSLPGYLRMGYHPLAIKGYRTRSGLIPLVRYLLTSNRVVEKPAGRIPTGRFGDVLVSRDPDPAMMSALAAREKEVNAITLLRDEAFFRWRFRNANRHYLFYQHLRAGTPVGYAVLGLSPHGMRGSILDWAPDDGSSLEPLLRHMIEARHFDLLSILDISLPASLSPLLDRLGFGRNDLLRIIERRMRGELPLLVRPVRSQLSPEDWLVGGLDAREIANWRFRGICGDET